jgi:cation transport ATPase
VLVSAISYVRDQGVTVEGNIESDQTGSAAGKQGRWSSRVPFFKIERIGRRVLVAVASGALAIGLAAWAADFGQTATWIWGIGTVPVAIWLLLSLIRDVLAGRVGVDGIAFVSMSAAILLGETLAGVVVAVMYAGGNVLEDFAVGRAERELKSLIDRAPRVAHRLQDTGVEDYPIETIAVGDAILVRAGEVVPVDGVTRVLGQCSTRRRCRANPSR